MKEFSIYCIKDEFAEHYFYKCDILYRFIKSHHANRFRQDLALQFNYITNNFPSDISFYVMSQLNRMDSIQISKDENQLEIYSDNHYLSLYVHKKQLKFHCKSLYEAENILFPALRLVDPYLFIINHNANEYGWLSPDKNKINITEGKELLYSYL